MRLIFWERFLHSFQWIILPNLSYLLLYPFCASLVHSLILSSFFFLTYRVCRCHISDMALHTLSSISFPCSFFEWPSIYYKVDCPGVYSFHNISAAEFGFKKFLILLSKSFLTFSFSVWWCPLPIILIFISSLVSSSL